MEISTNVSVVPNSAAKNTPFARITAQELKETWLKGYHTAAGYLYLLIKTLRADGWWLQINNVSEFCREWEISRKSFYKAKAQLIKDHRLEENIIGRIDIRIPVRQGVPQLELVTTDTVPVSLLGDTCYPPVTTCYHLVTAAPLGNTAPLEPPLTA
ncbi:MAG: hypothetical protein HC770_01740 [Pseudanabaena sp. CRU_2_10]|nr:hypothetical protein [Pseudanabaena sp. CRU_2_10]